MPELSQHSFAEEMAIMSALTEEAKRTHLTLSPGTANTIEGCMLALRLMTAEAKANRISDGSLSYFGRQLLAVANYKLLRELPATRA